MKAKFLKMFIDAFSMVLYKNPDFSFQGISGMKKCQFILE